MAEILKYVQRSSKFLTRFKKCSSRRIEDHHRTGQTQLATSEPLLLLMSFGCATQEIRENLKALIQHILEVQNFTVNIGQKLPSDFGSKDRDEFASSFPPFFNNTRGAEVLPVCF